MKRFINVMSVVLVLSAVATASTAVVKNDEVHSKIFDMARGICDPLEQLMGMCRSSENVLVEN